MSKCNTTDNTSRLLSSSPRQNKDTVVHFAEKMDNYDIMIILICLVNYTNYFNRCRLHNTMVLFWFSLALVIWDGTEIMTLCLYLQTLWITSFATMPTSNVIFYSLSIPNKMYFWKYLSWQAGIKNGYTYKHSPRRLRKKVHRLEVCLFYTVRQ